MNGESFKVLKCPANPVIAHYCSNALAINTTLYSPKNVGKMEIPESSEIYTQPT